MDFKELKEAFLSEDKNGTEMFNELKEITNEEFANKIIDTIIETNLENALTEELNKLQELLEGKSLEEIRNDDDLFYAWMKEVDTFQKVTVCKINFINKVIHLLLEDTNERLAKKHGISAEQKKEMIAMMSHLKKEN